MELKKNKRIQLIVLLHIMNILSNFPFDAHSFPFTKFTLKKKLNYYIL